MIQRCVWNNMYCTSSSNSTVLILQFPKWFYNHNSNNRVLIIPVHCSYIWEILKTCTDINQFFNILLILDLLYSKSRSMWMHGFSMTMCTNTTFYSRELIPKSYQDAPCTRMSHHFSANFSVNLMIVLYIWSL